MESNLEAINNVTYAVEGYLFRQGVNRHSIGYKYLITCILILFTEPAKIKEMRSVYRQAAQIYATNEINIERSIQATVMKLNTTNKDFIVMAADYLRYFSGCKKTSI